MLLQLAVLQNDRISFKLKLKACFFISLSSLLIAIKKLYRVIAYKEVTSCSSLLALVAGR
jgi:hypothetical protein